MYTRLWWGSWRVPPLPPHHMSTHRCVRRLVLNSPTLSMNASAWVAENATATGRILPGCQGHGCDANQTSVMCTDDVDFAAFPPEEATFPPVDYCESRTRSFKDASFLSTDFVRFVVWGTAS